MQRSHFIIGAIFLLTISVLDGALKHVALRDFSDGHSVHLFPFIDFFLHKNPGITFDIPVPLWVISPITLAVIFFLIDRISVRRQTAYSPTLGAIAIITGATNNFLDRMTNGFTTDYLMVFDISIINISDVLIMLGAGIFFWYSWYNPHALCNFIQPPPPHYGVFSRMFRSVIRFIRNTSHR